MITFLDLLVIVSMVLIAAKELIAGGELLDDAGSRVGLSDYSSFYRAFKREYGICPRQYRKMQQSNPR